MVDYDLPAASSIETGWVFAFVSRRIVEERDIDLVEDLVQGKGIFGIFSLSNRVI